MDLKKYGVALLFGIRSLELAIPKHYAIALWAMCIGRSLKATTYEYEAASFV